MKAITKAFWLALMGCVFWAGSAGAVCQNGKKTYWAGVSTNGCDYYCVEYYCGGNEGPTGRVRDFNVCG